MAQAARLNLRMQKELKLLLTDPPPGASFPTLSDDSSASSLTSIDALLQGPEGTVYADGVFKIKIQIPQRYPFQPPIVTFSTPIYHPNIDNGGRICLDILNLPPKGMWQPSLNISTVLTSIGLLLSEPNPDDGLMHEASRDYKYNRQAFDQNARSMTEKYARAGETESARGSHGTQTHTGRSTAQTKIEGSDASISIMEHRKLSLESLGSITNEEDSGKEIYKVPTHDYSKNHIKIGMLKEANNDLSKNTRNLGKLHAKTNKLSLKVSVASHSRNDESGKENLVPVGCLVPQLTCQSAASILSSVVSENGVHCSETEKQTNDVTSDKKQQINRVRDGESTEKFKQVAKGEGSQVTEAVIVLDSEDSEDEIVPVRSKLSLAKRCLSKKRKSCF